MDNLTPRQLEVVKFLEKFYKKNHIMPTLKQIGEKIDRTRASARTLLQELEKKGWIEIKKGARNYKLLHYPSEVFS